MNTENDVKIEVFYQVKMPCRLTAKDGWWWIAPQNIDCFAARSPRKKTR